MDKIFEKCVNGLASTPVIGLFGVWLITHTVIGSEDVYLSFISELAIFIGLLILRGQKVQSERQEKAIKQDLRKSDDIIKLLEK